MELKTTVFNDQLNLKSFLVLINATVKNCSAPETEKAAFYSMIGIIDILLDGYYDGDDKKARIVEIQRILSGNLGYQKLEPFCKKICGDRSILDRSLVSLAAFMNKYCPTFFDEVRQRISKRFFTDEEIDRFESMLLKDHGAAAISIILIHGLKNGWNIPCFFGERVFEEALSYDYNSLQRFNLFRIAAEEGESKKAALEYANYLANGHPNDEKLREAVRYFMMALPIKPALWNLGYFAQNGHLTEKEIKALHGLGLQKKILNDPVFDAVRTDYTFITKNSVLKKPEETVSWDIFFYLAYATDSYPKAFNSLAKMLHGRAKTLPADIGTRIYQMERKIYTKCVHLSCIPGLYNEAVEIMKKRMDDPNAKADDPEAGYMIELFEICAGAGYLHAYYSLGKYYAIDHLRPEGISKGDAIELFMTVLEKDEKHTFDLRGEIEYRIAMLLPQFSNRRIVHLKNAIAERYEDAIIVFAEDALNRSTIEDNTKILYEAVQFLDDSELSEEAKEKAIPLYNNIRSILRRFIKKEQDKSVAMAIRENGGFYD